MKKRGAVTFVFDDGYEHIFRDIVPLLDGHQFPAVFAVPLHGNIVEQTENYPTTSWQDWKQLVQKRHEIAAHSITHRNLTSLTDAELVAELLEPAAALQATTLIYPGGAWDARVRELAAHHYQAARTVEHGFETLPPGNRYQLKTYNFTKKNFSVWKANLLVLWAWITGRWLIETYHIVTDEPTTALHAVSKKDFARHLAFVKRLPISVRTIRDTVV